MATYFNAEDSYKLSSMSYVWATNSTGTKNYVRAVFAGDGSNAYQVYPPIFDLNFTQINGTSERKYGSYSIPRVYIDYVIANSVNAANISGSGQYTSIYGGLPDDIQIIMYASSAITISDTIYIAMPYEIEWTRGYGKKQTTGNLIAYGIYKTNGKINIGTGSTTIKFTRISDYYYANSNANSSFDNITVSINAGDMPTYFTINNSSAFPTSSSRFWSTFSAGAGRGIDLSGTGYVMQINSGSPSPSSTTGYYNSFTMYSNVGNSNIGYNYPQNKGNTFPLYSQTNVMYFSYLKSFPNGYTDNVSSVTKTTMYFPSTQSTNECCYIVNPNRLTYTLYMKLSDNYTAPPYFPYYANEQLSISMTSSSPAVYSYNSPLYPSAYTYFIYFKIYDGVENPYNGTRGSIYAQSPVARTYHKCTNIFDYPEPSKQYSRYRYTIGTGATYGMGYYANRKYINYTRYLSRGSDYAKAGDSTVRLTLGSVSSSSLNNLTKFISIVGIYFSTRSSSWGELASGPWYNWTVADRDVTAAKSAIAIKGDTMEGTRGVVSGFISINANNWNTYPSYDGGSPSWWVVSGNNYNTTIPSVTINIANNQRLYYWNSSYKPVTGIISDNYGAVGRNGVRTINVTLNNNFINSDNYGFIETGPSNPYSATQISGLTLYAHIVYVYGSSAQYNTTIRRTVRSYDYTDGKAFYVRWNPENCQFIFNRQ